MAANTRAIEAGRAEIRYGLNTEDLPGELGKLAKGMRSFGKRLQRIGQVGVAAGGAIVGAFAGVATQFAKTGDHLDKMSQRTGIGVEALSELAHAADQSGTDIDQLGAAIFRATRRIGNATSGTGPAVRALEELGLAADQVAQLAPVDQFELLVDRLNQVDNEARRSQLGFELFGDNWRQLTPLINQGAEGISALRQEARDLGIVMSTEDATAAADLTDAMAELWSQVKGVGLAVGAAVAGPLTDFIRVSQPIIAMTIQWIKENGSLIATVGAVAAVVTVASTAIVVIGTVMSSAVTIATALTTAIGFLSAAVTFLLTPIGLLVAGLLAAVAAWLYFSGAGSSAIDAIGRKVSQLGSSVKTNLGLDDLGNIPAATGGAGAAAPIPVVPTLPPETAAALANQSQATMEHDASALEELKKQTIELIGLRRDLAGAGIVAGA